MDGPLQLQKLLFTISSKNLTKILFDSVENFFDKMLKEFFEMYWARGFSDKFSWKIGFNN